MSPSPDRRRARGRHIPGPADDQLTSHHVTQDPSGDVEARLAGIATLASYALVGMADKDQVLEAVVVLAERASFFLANGHFFVADTEVV